MGVLMSQRSNKAARLPRCTKYRCHNLPMTLMICSCFSFLSCLRSLLIVYLRGPPPSCIRPCRLQPREETSVRHPRVRAVCAVESGIGAHSRTESEGQHGRQGSRAQGEYVNDVRTKKKLQAGGDGRAVQSILIIERMIHLPVFDVTYSAARAHFLFRVLCSSRWIC